MTDRDTSPLRRAGFALQQLFRSRGLANVTPSTLAANGVALPLRLRLADGPPLELDDALNRAPRLMVVDPASGNGPALLEALAARRPLDRYWGILLTAPPGIPPDLLAAQVAARAGTRLRPNAVAAALAQGQVVWLIPDPTLIDVLTPWLSACLAAYPHSRVILLTRTASTVPPGDSYTLASIEPPDWAIGRAWLMQYTPEARLALARVGGQAEVRAAVSANAVLREALAGPLPATPRLASLYTAWLERLLAVASPDVLARAADVAWRAQVTGDPPGPDPALDALLYEPHPGSWEFLHPALRHALASRAPDASLAALLPYLAEPEWREVIALWASHAPDAPALLDHILSLISDPQSPTSALLPLAFRILEEMPNPPRDAEATLLVATLDSMRQAQAEAQPTEARALGQTLADHLGMIDTRDSFAGPLALARHSSPQVRLAAVHVLRDSSSEAARRELRARLADDDPTVARAAAEALSQGGERAVPALMLALADPRDSARDMAVLGLAAAGEVAVPALAEVLTGYDQRVAEAAARALAAMGPPGVPVLAQACLAQPSSPASVALVEVGRRDPHAVLAVLAATSQAQRPQAGVMLRRIGLPMRGALIEELDRPASPAADLAVDILADSRDGDPAVVQALTRALGDSRVRIRMRASAALARLGPDSVPLMLQAAAAEPDAQGRVIEIVSRIPGVTVDAALVTALLRVMRGASPEVRRAAARLLGQTPAPQAVESLLAALADPDAALRAEAAHALAAADVSEATEPIAQALAVETDAEAHAALLLALAHLDPAAALPLAMTALADPDDRVRKAAIAVAREVGPRAVDYVVEAVCQSGSMALRSNAIDLLGEFAARQASAAEPAYDVARVWHSLLTQRFSASGARERTAGLGWWGHGREIHLSYVTADAFAAYQDAGDLADAPNHLYWLSHREDWLRPQVQEVLRSLGRIGRQAETYLSAPGVDASGTAHRRLGLQSLEQRLRGLEDALDASRLDLSPFLDVIRHWRELVRRAAVEASGEPALTLALLTERVRLHDGQPVTLSLVVYNGGDGAARAVRVAVDGKAAAQAGLVVTESAWLLPVIEPQQTYRLDVRVHASQVMEAPLTFRLRYEDAHRLSHSSESQVRVRLVRDARPYQDIGLNPYIAGPPIRVQEMFFGRRATLTWIEEQLVGKHGHNVLILYGERRTGKTSVLYHVEDLPRFGGGRYLFALLDLQQMAYWLDSTAHFYYGLAHRLRDKLTEQGIILERPSLVDFEAMPGLRFDEFIRDAVAALDGRILVIMLDEFDLLLDRFHRGLIDLSVADHIRALIQHENHLAFIFTGAHSVRAMVEDPKTILFNTAFRRQIGFLAESDARHLIRQPVEGLVEYDDLAVDRILDVTHGHPYFIQYICHALFERLKEERRNVVDLTDVVDVLGQVIQDAMGNIANGYTQLSAEHRVILAALARVVGQGRRFVSMEEVVQQLEEYNINIPRRERDHLIEDLKRRDFIEADPPASVDRIGFTMDLVKMWLSEQADHELRDYQGLSNVI